MSGGIPLRPIALTNLVLVIVMLTAGVVLAAIGAESLANVVVGAAVGSVIGGGATTAVLQVHEARNGNGDGT